MRNGDGAHSSRLALCEVLLVPLAGIEPALLAELDFESSASTNSATGVFHDARAEGLRVKSRRNIAGADGRSTRGRLRRQALPPTRLSARKTLQCDAARLDSCDGA